MTQHSPLFSDVRKALAHLDDPVYLESLDLARHIDAVNPTLGRSRGQSLRRALLLAMDLLDPRHAPDNETIDTRCYQVLNRYAIAKRSIVAIAGQLGMSERQAYRELYRAIDALAATLEDIPTSHPGAAGEQRTTNARIVDELERVAITDEQNVDIGQLLDGVLASVQPLARERGLTLTLHRPDHAVFIFTNRVMLRQAIINLLSHATSVYTDRQLVVEIGQTDKEVVIVCSCPPSDERQASDLGSPYAMARQILATLGFSWREQSEQGCPTVRLGLTRVLQHAVLIIDDNEGLITLFRRYLRNQPFQVMSASSLNSIHQALGQTSPDVVVLDIMLPNQDGWEILQTLRSLEQTRQARVIVCSIINDPRLAFALGADAFLHKPVDRARFLRAIQQVLA